MRDLITCTENICIRALQGWPSSVTVLLTIKELLCSCECELLLYYPPLFASSFSELSLFPSNKSSKSPKLTARKRQQRERKQSTHTLCDGNRKVGWL